jgi:hypothetical protein
MPLVETSLAVSLQKQRYDTSIYRIDSLPKCDNEAAEVISDCLDSKCGTKSSKN